MCNTDKTIFKTESEAIPLEDMTQVYEGSVTINPGTNFMSFILSEELLKKLPGTDVYYPQPMGSFELKGKKNEISVFSLDFPLDNQK